MKPHFSASGSFFKDCISLSVSFVLIVALLVLSRENSWGQAINLPSNSNQNTGIPQIPEPPYFFNTGNPTADSVNYSVAKEEWISDVVNMFEILLGQMELSRKATFKQSLRKIDFEAARNGDYTLPIIENPYAPFGEVELY